MVKITQNDKAGDNMKFGQYLKSMRKDKFTQKEFADIQNWHKFEPINIRKYTLKFLKTL